MTSAFENHFNNLGRPCSFCASPHSMWHYHDYKGGLTGDACTNCSFRVNQMSRKELDTLITQRLVIERLIQGV